MNELVNIVNLNIYYQPFLILLLILMAKQSFFITKNFVLHFFIELFFIRSIFVNLFYLFFMTNSIFLKLFLDFSLKSNIKK